MAGLVSQAMAADPVPKRGGTAIFAIADDPSGFVRNLSTVQQDGLFSCMFYQGLTRLTPAGDLKPMLAKSWTVSDDGKTYSFDLVDAKWWDGKPLTSADVKFTYLDVSAKYSSVFAGTGRAIEAIETPAPDKLIIKLKYPYGPALLSMTCLQGGGILPAHVFQGTDILKNPAIQAPVGIGPFMLKEWKRGDFLRLARNPDYWEKGKPYLDELIAKVIPSGASRSQALMSGEIDLVNYFNVQTNDYPMLRANKKLVLTEAAKPPGVEMIFLNNTHKPLDDKRVRQALFMALDREFIVRAAFQGLGEVGTMPFTAKLPWTTDPSIDYRKMYPYDPARANALLDEAGVKRGANGTRFTLNMHFYTTLSGAAATASAMKNMWGAVGVNLNILPGETAAVNKRVFVDGDYDVSMMAYISQGDPALGIARTFVTSSIGLPNGNGARYSNPVVDDLFEKGALGTTEAERGVFYKRAQVILAEDLPVFTLREQLEFDAKAANLRGLEEENFLLTWREAWFDK
jgi:peptide/nickel transport system substrate-binding protein